MPILFEQTRGKPSLAFLRTVSGENAPSTVTATVSSAGASLGATSIPVSSLPGAIPKNTVLQFTNAAGNTLKAKVVVTADAGATDTSLAVNSFEGAQGAGIDVALLDTDKAIWDGLWTDGASNNLDFSANEQTQELTAVTHGSATSVNVAAPEVTAVQPSFTRQGFLLNEGPLLTALLTNVKTPNQNWWAKLVIAAYDGAPAVTYEGLGRVFGVGHPAPADGLVAMQYSFRFIRNAFTVTPGVTP